MKSGFEMVFKVKVNKSRNEISNHMSYGIIKLYTGLCFKIIHIIRISVLITLIIGTLKQFISGQLFDMGITTVVVSDRAHERHDLHVTASSDEHNWYIVFDVAVS